MRMGHAHAPMKFYGRPLSSLVSVTFLVVEKWGLVGHFSAQKTYNLLNHCADGRDSFCIGWHLVVHKRSCNVRRAPW